METFIMQIFNGISVSSIYLLASLGLAITFGLMGVINMAHGEFIMIGAYTAYVVQNLFRAYLPAGVFDAYVFVAIIASFFTAAFFGAGAAGDLPPLRKNRGQSFGYLGSKPGAAAAGQKHFWSA